MFANKKHLTNATVGVLVTLSIIALVLSLLKIEDVTLPPTAKVRPKEGPRAPLQRPVTLGRCSETTAYLWG